MSIDDLSSRPRRVGGMLSAAWTMVVPALCVLLVASLLPLAPIESPGSPDTPLDRPSGDFLPPAPPWPPLTDGDSGQDSWPMWDAFRSGPQYVGDLNVPIEDAHFYENMSTAFSWTNASWDKLRQNGFVVFPPSEHDIELMYRHYWVNDLPVFITTDTILHVEHLLFDQMLQDLENISLRPMVENLSAELVDQAAWLRTTLPDSLAEAATDAVVFYAVPNVLLQTDSEIPDDVASRVRGIVATIESAGDVGGADWPETDWTQYKPRGHYDRSEFLQRYFRAMMWYGRASFDVEKEEDLVPAALTAAIVSGSQRGQALWTRVYNATARLVGESDSLNHLDIRRGFMNRLGTFDVALLADPANVAALNDEFASDVYYRQKILSAVVKVPPEQALNGPPVVFPKIYQFMGQRYVIDSEVMQNVMFDRVPLYEWNRRGLPSGLDVAATLGSPRAVDLLADELALYRYETQLRQQWSAVSNKSEAFWNRTVYSRHLDAVREILRPAPDRAPLFAQTQAWATEKVNTGLGSWAELRHDTILYAKQPYSVFITCSTPEGWVEPYPEFFRRMAWLAEEVPPILQSHFGGDVEPAVRFSAVYGTFAEINHRLADIAQAELDGRDLTVDEVTFIRDIFVNSKTDSYGWIEENFGWLPNLLKDANVTDQTRDARIIADVATDPGSEVPPMPPRVLHAAVGAFGHVIVAYQTRDGEWHLAAGPVYSYYELAPEGFTRFTDGEWKDLPESETPPERPAWASEFLGG